jgi:hypothetical protein
MKLIKYETMEIIKNAFVNRNGSYYESGGIVDGTQRILTNHQTKYWQQGNVENMLAIDVNNIINLIEIKEAIYVGRIPMHFGHFIMEGMARLCDVVNLDKPIIGYITMGYLPDGIKSTPEKEIRWFISCATDQYFYEVNDDETYFVKNLFVPKLPYHLSQSCSEPWRMTNLIKKIVFDCRLKHSDINEIDVLYLKRNEEEVFYKECVISDPNSELSKQIAMVSKANKLIGKCGSNTHLSIFAKNNCFTEWTQRGNFNECDRNQLICDLIKTYNYF